MTPETQSADTADASGPLIGNLDEDAEMILFSVVGSGGLPGEDLRSGPGFEEETVTPYWATWGF